MKLFVNKSCTFCVPYDGLMKLQMSVAFDWGFLTSGTESRSSGFTSTLYSLWSDRLKHWCNGVLLSPTFHQAVQDHAAELIIAELLATARNVLLEPIRRQHHVNYTLQSHRVVGNHQVQSVFKSEGLIMNILHVTVLRTKQKSHIMSSWSWVTSSPGYEA